MVIFHGYVSHNQMVYTVYPCNSMYIPKSGPCLLPRKPQSQHHPNSPHPRCSFVRQLATCHVVHGRGELKLPDGNPQRSWISNTFQIFVVCPCLFHICPCVSWVFHGFFHIFAVFVALCVCRDILMLCSSGAAAALRRTRVSQRGPAANGWEIWATSICDMAVDHG